jgi:hypothetical protein
MKKKLLICKNDNYNGSSCPRCLTKQNFLEFPAFEFATEGVILNCDTCGSELSWETVEVKKPLNPKLIAIIAAGVLVLGGLVFFLTRGGSSGEELVAETEIVESLIPEPDLIEEVAEEVPVAVEPDPIKVAEPAPVKTQPLATTTAAPKGTQTLTLSGGLKYTGEVMNGRPHGLGTMYYNQQTLISPKDLKKRMAEAGDYITGEFFEGSLVQGKLFDSKNALKEVVLIGR